jgi:hypothetical protein
MNAPERVGYGVNRSGDARLIDAVQVDALDPEA